MAATASTKWFWTDWLGDQEVRALTPAERGLWIDLLGLAAVGNPIGYVCDRKGDPISYEEIARLANCSPTDVVDLVGAILAKGAASLDRDHRLFNRRMVRDARLAARRAKAGKKGGERTQVVWNDMKRLKSQAHSFLPEQVPRQNRSAPFPNRNTTTSEFGAAREGGPQPRPESVEAPKGLQEGQKRPHETSRAELDAMIERRKATVA